ncbi:MAG: ROK family protein [Fimbriimonas sp.]
MKACVGLDLGGNSINVATYDGTTFGINAMCELPSLAKSGPDACVAQLVSGFELALETSGHTRDQIASVGLDTPGPASATGVISSKGATNFSQGWENFDIRAALENALGLHVHYLNDGNAAALYAHWVQFGGDPSRTSVSLIIGTGLGGGVVANGRVLVGKVGYAAELGHVTLPSDWNPEGHFETKCNCGKINDLESVASLTAIELNLLPHYLPQYPEHELNQFSAKDAAKKVRGLAEKGDELSRRIFRAQTWALAAHIDQLINVFDPDAIFIGGGGVEAGDELREWFIESIRSSIPFREEQKDLDLEIIPQGDMAGARGAAIYALQHS